MGVIQLLKIRHYETLKDFTFKIACEVDAAHLIFICRLAIFNIHINIKYFAFNSLIVV